MIPSATRPLQVGGLGACPRERLLEINSCIYLQFILLKVNTKTINNSKFYKYVN